VSKNISNSWSILVHYFMLVAQKCSGCVGCWTRNIMAIANNFFSSTV